MNVLGIETSCDETAAAVVTDGRFIRSNVVASSLKDHKKYGGIVPEIASRRQMEYISPVVREALNKARCRWKDIDSVAVTSRPGLVGSLLVGVAYAQALARTLNKPLIKVDHIPAHLYANFLTTPENKTFQPPELPAVGLVVSGGHTSLYLVKNFRSLKLLGQTRDDAAGEAYDKVARILDLGYPGGPVIDRLARNSKNPNIRFTCATIPDTLDFSFSGIKTAVLYYDRKHNASRDYSKQDVVAAFQTSVISVLTDKTIDAAKQYKAKSILIGGGVAANSALRKLLMVRAGEQNLNVFFPPMALCVDNAAMVAGLANTFLPD